ncbi:KTSC domain-containing protein [Gramella jeungdoensis]|uniref:KTSC domain-containing protein n=1 Tax=Gramella jeungdoensis TaxID=708091 RepID=A0ABT0Z4K9_9FLAO|nr:KTSC domain-containing protein [Gramella jeungdoensis]MCM8569699.1 KTSC domain-containing protein [Gramella jeungdoensis]
MIKYLPKILLMALLCSCQGQQNCRDLPQQFESYYTAKDKISNAAFKVEDTFNTSRSSWIKNAHYYSCNGRTGFLIISTKTDSYIHQNVPVALWNEFKVASSLGRFYNLNLKNKYQLTPEN